MLSMLKLSRYIAPSVAISEIGTASAGMMVAVTPPQEQEDHQDDERDRQQQRELHVVDGVADRDRAIVEHVQGRCARQLLVEARQQRLDAIDHLHRVGFGLAVDRRA